MGSSEETASSDRASKNTPKVTKELGYGRKEANTAMPVLAWRNSSSRSVASASGCHGSASDWLTLTRIQNPTCAGAVDR